ncbi:MAG: hypothetical protein K9K82_05245, partial [Desulfobacteraceae bacterium]|nr:hypothetical protein [Desulfobacteraceae bacterium]
IYKDISNFLSFAFGKYIIKSSSYAKATFCKILILLSFHHAGLPRPPVQRPKKRETLVLKQSAGLLISYRL